MNVKRTYRLAAILLLAVCITACLSGCISKDAGSPKLTPGVIPEGWSTGLYLASSGTVEVVSDSRYGAAVHIASSEPNDVRLICPVTADNSHMYTVTCMVKTQNVSEGAGANLGVYGSNVNSEFVYGSTDWRELSFTVSPKGYYAEDGWKSAQLGSGAGGNTLNVSLCLGGHGALSVGEAWFTDVRIKEQSIFPTNEILLATAGCAVLMLALYLLHRIFANKPYKPVTGKNLLPVIAILVGAFAVRVALALRIEGHKTDINCFVYWGRRVTESGPAAFYDSWCDYPPGYMLVLGLMAKIGALFNVSDYSFLIKLPAMIADLISAYLVYAYAKRRMSRGAALTLMALVAFMPVLAYISAGWGQIDQVLSLLLVVPILLLYDRKPIWAGIIYGLAIIVKPQALMAGPLFAAAYLLYVIKGSPYKKFAVGRGLARLTGVKNDSVGHRLFETVLAVIGAVAVIIIIAVPFTGSQPWHWLIDKYYGTATSYDYATVNAYNFWAMIGGNWKSTDTPFLGMTYGKWGTLFMAFAVISSIAAYVYAALRHKNCKGALPLVMAYMFAAIFTFGHYMHERYIFPVFLLLVFAYIFYNDRRILWAYLAYGVTILLNCFAAFYYAGLMDTYKALGYEGSIIFNYDIITWCSAANVLAFLFTAYVTADLVIRNKPFKAYNG